MFEDLVFAGYFVSTIKAFELFIHCVGRKEEREREREWKKRETKHYECLYVQQATRTETK